MPMHSATMLNVIKANESSIVDPSPQHRPRKVFANIESISAIVPPFPAVAMAR